MGFDVVTVGSGTVDIFIHPKDAELGEHADHVDVCYHIGEKVLIDQLVQDTGGGGTNAAVAFARLGMKTGWLGVLGDDANAESVRAALKKERVDVLGQTIKGQTGLSVIMVGLRHDRAILAFKGVNDKLEKAPKFKTKFLYCSAMLGESFKTLIAIVQRCRKERIPWAFNPSMYIARQGLVTLRPIIKDAELLICNKEEAAALLRSKPDVQHMLRELAREAKHVVITDGPRGAFGTDGTTMFTIKPRPIKVVETTGAGDAFASGVVAGLIWRKGLAFGLCCGMAEAESVIQYVGAKNKLLKKSELLAATKRYKVDEAPL